MAMTLYHGEPNGPSLTVLATLFEKGLENEVELKRIDLAAGERHELPVAKQLEVSYNLEGEGPVLVVDGEPLTDGLFIALFLDDLKAQPRLLPTQPVEEWNAMMWGRLVTERLQAAAATLGTRAYLSPRYAGGDKNKIEAAIARIESADLADRWRQTVAGDYPEAQIADSHRKVKFVVDRVEQALDGKDWLLDDFTVTDLDVYAWLAAMPLLSPGSFENAPRTRAWLNRVEARPSVQRALSLATVEDPKQSWAVGPEHSRWG